MGIYANKKELIEGLVGPHDVVLDVGFWGQGVNPAHANWVHNILRHRAREVWGVDLEYDSALLPQADSFYQKASAEDFSLPVRFDVVFAGDLIEHLSNPGLFLACAQKHLKPGDRLILSTPNAFNLFNLTEKLTKAEPTVNPDHTCYFNSKTLSVLLRKNGWEVSSVGFLYSLGLSHRESWKKKVLNAVYGILARFTSKYVETLIVVAKTS